MNKSELIQALAQENDVTPDEARVVVEQFFQSIMEALKEGNRVEIRGFGSFKLKDYSGYTGRNPRTGDVVQVEPKRLPFFRASLELKRFLNPSD